MSFSDSAENILIDYVFGNITPPDSSGNIFPPLQYEVGLLLNVPPIETSGGIATPVEPTGNNYSRVTIANNKTTWSSAAVGGLIVNDIEIAFPKADGGNWGTVNYVGLFSVHNGDLIAYGEIGVSGGAIVVNDGFKVVLNPGDIVVTLD